MAIASIQEFPIGDRSTENYEFMKAKLEGDRSKDSSCTRRGSTTATACGGWWTSGRRVSTPID
jgi:hypothetical protein